MVSMHSSSNHVRIRTNSLATVATECEIDSITVNASQHKGLREISAVVSVFTLHMVATSVCSLCCTLCYADLV